MINWLKCLWSGHKWPGTWSYRVGGFTSNVVKAPVSFAYEKCSRCGEERPCDWNLGEDGYE